MCCSSQQYSTPLFILPPRSAACVKRSSGDSVRVAFSEQTMTFVLFIVVMCSSFTSPESIPLSNSSQVNSAQNGAQDNENPAVTRFREYLRINSSHPNPNYEGCITWLRGQADQIGLDFQVKWFEPPNSNSFAVWLTWNGTDPTLKSILLDSHMDTVAVSSEKWTHPPFEAYKDENGTIYARGTQDSKSRTVAHLEAIRRLKADDFRPLRTIHLSILPDEEHGSFLGMQQFVNSTEFTSMNVGFQIEESSTSPADEILVEYGQKAAWQFNFTIAGVAAHGSKLPNKTAGEKLQIIIDRLMAFRTSQVALLSLPNITMADVTSVNLVQMGGGVDDSTIPGELWVAFDMRIRTRPGWNFIDAMKMLNDLAEEAGPGVTINYFQKTLIAAETAVDSTNVWWVQLQGACRQSNVTCVPGFENGATDARFTRNLGIPVFGFSPFIHTADLAHQDNECINEKEFLDAIDRYVALVRNSASVPAVDHP